MSTKQDKTFPRTATDLERKYKFKGTFAEIIGMIDETRGKVDSVESSLRSETEEHITALARDTQQIIMSALSSYTSKEEYEELERKVSAEFEMMSEQILMHFTDVTNTVEEVDGELQRTNQTLEKYFEFSTDGLIIKAGESTMQLQLDNDVIRFVKNGQEFGWWDGVDFHTGNIVINVNERAQFGNFAYIPRSNGNLSFLKVGE